MKDLRERCEKLALQHRESHCKCCRNGEFEISARFDLIGSIEALALSIRNETRQEDIDAAKAAKCGSDTPWDCGCDPGIKAIEKLRDTTTLAAGRLGENNND